MTDELEPAATHERQDLPPGLWVAVVLVVLEALVMAAYGISELAHLRSGRVVMGVTTAVFLLGYGAALVWCAWGITRLRTWARSPVILTQLIWLGLAWNFRHGETQWLSVVISVPAAIALVAMLLPRSFRALND